MTTTDVFKVAIPMYGLAYEITSVRSVEVEVRDGAVMGEVIAAMRAKEIGRAHV